MGIKKKKSSGSAAFCFDGSGLFKGKCKASIDVSFTVTVKSSVVDHSQIPQGRLAVIDSN